MAAEYGERAPGAEARVSGSRWGGAGAGGWRGCGDTGATVPRDFGRAGPRNSVDPIRSVGCARDRGEKSGFDL